MKAKFKNTHILADIAVYNRRLQKINVFYFLCVLLSRTFAVSKHCIKQGHECRSSLASDISFSLSNTTPEAVPQGPQCLGEHAPKSRGREKAAGFPPDCPLLHGSSGISTFTMIWFQLGFKQEPWDEGHGTEEAVACLGRSCLKSPSWPGSCLSVLVVDEVTAPRAGEWGQVHRKQMS